MDRVAQMVTFMGYDDYKVEVQGHTDDRGAIPRQRSSTRRRVPRRRDPGHERLQGAAAQYDARLAAAGLVPRCWLRLRVALSAGLGTLTVIAGLWPALPGVGTGT